jgi:hypothetical protein
MRKSYRGRMSKRRQKKERNKEGRGEEQEKWSGRRKRDRGRMREGQK